MNYRRFFADESVVPINVEGANLFVQNTDLIMMTASNTLRDGGLVAYQTLKMSLIAII